MNISPFFPHALYKRVTEDLVMRKLATKSHVAYIRGINKFCDYFNRSPGNATRYL